MKTKLKRKRCPMCLDFHDAIHKQLYGLEMILNSIELKWFETEKDESTHFSRWELNNLSGAILATRDNISRMLNRGY